MNNKIDLTDTTLVIPIRIDSLERIENLRICTDYILKFFNTNIILLEADKKYNSIVKNFIDSNIEYHFIEDNDPVFHRTKYINTLLGYVKTEIVAVWDSDVIVNPRQILFAVLKIRENSHDFSYPYDGRFFDTGVEHRSVFINTFDISYLEANTSGMILPYTLTACGGGFFANLAVYKETGMENENFYGWGQEDGERVKRWHILKKRVIRVVGPLFHLYHPRGINSTYLSEEHKQKQINEFYRISNMNFEELELEIMYWNRSRLNMYNIF